MATTTLPSIPPEINTCFIHLRLSPSKRRRISPSSTSRRHIFTHSATRQFVRIKASAFPYAGGGGLLLQDAAATVVVSGGAYGLVSTFDYLTDRNIVEQFSTSTEARYVASIVPFLNCLRLIIYGFSMATDEGRLTKSLTREGKPEELLKGPFYYVLVLIVSALIFWRESPVGVISVALMCAGDGIADIVGRRFGSLKLPYNQNKSFAGSISMFAFGSLASVGMLYYFAAFGFIDLSWDWTIKSVALVALVATLVESLPASSLVDDNISVPLASMITALLMFRDQYS